jgi:hypothetical protein
MGSSKMTKLKSGKIRCLLNSEDQQILINALKMCYRKASLYDHQHAAITETIEELQKERPLLLSSQLLMIRELGYHWIKDDGTRRYFDSLISKIKN